MKRGFEIVSKYKDQKLTVPYRTTVNAAGYDFESAVDMTIPSIWKLNFLKILWAIKHGKEASPEKIDHAKKILKPFLIPTGIKAYMQPDEVLIIANRSSNPLKRGLAVPNGIGVIDADYYNNSGNEGEIFVQIINFGITDIKISKGERIAQGIFIPYLLADQDDHSKQKTRHGGFGSSGR
ncbi:dCTP deaminase/dUTPase family protein [Lentilactobacillus hilgardii]|uniref:dUTP diphosphatase n=1 Tax=Lentilactobacillus hilgardii TaxID=1588 RepID=UPI0021C3A7AB|nr:dUTP diphosphatase [Lentilactobacillus hilgardii]MCP9332264.1 dUTP diphosphatase [Lentilactobacillus hilgardii]MCP9348743.1 dUTP diphosphatase [Lentilactobacillus hilgardii]MCP9351678.1 dUTP diphosphatase [Lentilactobacillus hilgardii]